MDTSGQGSGEGSHLSIYVYIMKGQHDDLSGLSQVPSSLSSSTAFGKNRGREQFISHSSLSLNSSTYTQYLHQDCIRVRVQAM